MPEVHSVYATVRAPKDDADLGQVTTGHYTPADGVLTMTDSKGAAVRDLNSGEKIQHEMQLGDDARAIASRLTMKVYRMLRGETTQAATGFNRPLNYQPSGIA
jgi:hypothetical protein